MTNSILLTGDITRIEIYNLEPGLTLSRCNQNANIKMIASAVRWPLRQVFGVDPKTLLGDTSRANIQAVIKASEASASSEGGNRVWDLYAENFFNVDPRLIEALSEVAPHHPLVVGFELSPAMRTWLNNNNHIYLSLSFHPYRFLHDLLFNVVSNSSRLLAAIKLFEVGDSAVETAVDDICAMAARYRGIPDWLPEGTAVVACQTRYDQTVLADGRFVSMTDRLEELKASVQGAPFVIIHPHPYAGEDYGIERSLLSFLGPNAMILSGNAYALLANEKVSSIISLSSGLNHEARRFRKSATFLLRDPMEVHCAGAIGKSVVVRANTVRRTGFWIAIGEALGLSPIGGPHEECDVPPFRKLIGLSWAYNDLARDSRQGRIGRIVNLLASQLTGEALVREAFKQIVDCILVPRQDIEYHCSVIAQKGRLSFLRSMIASEQGRALNASILE